MNIVLLGAPGAGKGTQSRLIQANHDLVLIATGDLLREEIKSETPLGLQVKNTIESGLFPSDEVVLKLFEDRLMQVKGQGVVLDGVPRTLNQAQRIDTLFDRLGMTLNAVIQISVTDEELIRRLSTRVICAQCGATYALKSSSSEQGLCEKCGSPNFMRRPDDEPEAIKTRLDIYNEQTKPLLQYYSSTDRLKVVDGMKSVAEVNGCIESLLKELQVLTTNSRCLYSAQDI